MFHICNNLNSLTLGFSSVVWLKLAQWFWNIFFNFDVFRYFIIISPWKMALTLHFSSPKDALCQVWLKLAEWFWWRRFLNYTKLLVFSLFPHYLPLEKSMALHLNKLESPLLKLRPSLAEIGPVVLQKIFKISRMYLIIPPWSFIWTKGNPL